MTEKLIAEDFEHIARMLKLLEAEKAPPKAAEPAVKPEDTQGSDWTVDDYYAYGGI